MEAAVDWRISSENESMTVSSWDLKAPNTERLRNGPPITMAKQTSAAITEYSMTD
jgi:hypothetical protein